jgi:hypothetical protein
MDPPEGFSLAALVYEEGSLGVFLLVTVALGGGGAWLTGGAIASTWRPIWQVVGYALLLGLVVRFFHFALFGGTLLSFHYYLVDAGVCVLLGLAGFRANRVRQMIEQYHWLNMRSGPLGWRRRTP